jgi:DNA-binding MarR family transcriptional regulator
MPPRKSQPQREQQERHPVASLAHDLAASVLRTASVMRRGLDRGLDGSGLSGAQYHVLRILRGAEPGGLPTLAVRERLTEEAPGITRLLNKLARAGLVVRERNMPDRRQVICRIAPRGLALLADIEPRVHTAIERLGARLTRAEQRQCLALLDALRRREAP